MAKPELGKMLQFLDLNQEAEFPAQEIRLFEDQAVLVPADIFGQPIYPRIIKAVMDGLTREFADDLPI